MGSEVDESAMPPNKNRHGQGRGSAEKLLADGSGDAIDVLRPGPASAPLSVLRLSSFEWQTQTRLGTTRMQKRSGGKISLLFFLSYICLEVLSFQFAL